MAFPIKYMNHSFIHMYVCRWEVNWGDESENSIEKQHIESFGPFQVKGRVYKKKASGYHLTVKYCHNSMSYMGACCDTYTHYINYH